MDIYKSRANRNSSLRYDMCLMIDFEDNKATLYKNYAIPMNVGDYKIANKRWILRNFELCEKLGMECEVK